MSEITKLMDTHRTLTTRAAALLVLTVMSGLTVTAQLPVERQIHRLSLAERSWALDISLSDFTVSSERSDGSSYTLFGSRLPTESGSLHAFSCQIFISPASGPGDASSVREVFKKKKKNVEGLKSGEHKEIPILEYRMGSTFNPYGSGTSSVPSMKMMEAFWVYDQTWINVMVGFMGSITPGDRSFFYSLIDSVKFVDTSASTSSFDYYQKGRALYVRHEYPAAIKFFIPALEMEKKSRELENGQWTRLIMELADCYGATGQLTTVKQLLDYAVSQNPSEYLFHWALARYYATTGALNNTIESLRLAYMHQPAELRNQKIQTGGYLVDPLIDKAFERFHKVEAFRKAVKEMKQRRG